MAHALARAFAPERDHDSLAGGLDCPHVPAHGFEHVAAGLGALGGEIAPLLGARVDGRPLPFGHGERGQSRERDGLEPRAPFGLAQIKPLGRQRVVWRARTALGERLPARLVVILDLAQPLARGVLGQRLEHHGARRHVVE